MANYSGYNARQLTGYNIYHIHEKNQTIYYDTFTKTGYIITNQYVSKFSTWQMRLPLSIMLGSLLVLLRLNVWLSILIGVVVYVVSTILFHTIFLKDLPIQKNFVRPKSKGFFRDLAARYPKGILRILFIMFIIMAIVMIGNQIITKAVGSARTLTIVFVVLASIAAIIIGYCMYLKDKENL